MVSASNLNFTFLFFFFPFALSVRSYQDVQLMNFQLRELVLQNIDSDDWKYEERQD